MLVLEKHLVESLVAYVFALHLAIVLDHGVQ
jgi:hypothetical protein